MILVHAGTYAEARVIDGKSLTILAAAGELVELEGVPFFSPPPLSVVNLQAGQSVRLRGLTILHTSSASARRSTSRTPVIRTGSICPTSRPRPVT